IPAAGFGYQVVQRKSDLLVSAPLEQHGTNRRGRIYSCGATACTPLPFAVNMSLGLSMTTDPATSNTMVCGPTIPKDCKSITMYNGACFQLDSRNVFEPPVPSSHEGQAAQLDISFVLDGSGSVSPQDFGTMKGFVKQLVDLFGSEGTQYSVAEFSAITMIYYYFNDFFQRGNWRQNIDRIPQQGGGTRTARAIQDVVDSVFTPSKGSRDNVKKVMIVITDGESQDGYNLAQAVNSAARKNIIRFAIGVGNAFRRTQAKQELDTIASYPPDDHVFRVDNFNALQKIQENLRDKIFSIEGSQSGGQSLKMEMAQEGFRAAYVPGGFQLAVVGANQWKGGYMSYTQNRQLKNTYEPQSMEPDSYLGYSMAVARINGDSLTIVGAPRYQHRGIVMTVHNENTMQKIDPFPWQFQTGEYFGAEVCAMDTDGNGNTDLILISAPMHSESDREGRVYVCGMTSLKVDCHFNSPSVLRGEAFEKGRFGSSVAVLPDLDTNGFMDLAVGAPLENDGQGSIYIFQSEGLNRIDPIYSQRIAGSQVQSGLKFFGMSISQQSFDRSEDGLPDLAVGSKGTVIILRSKPIVMVKADVTFSPNQIPTQNVVCSNPSTITAKICFFMSSRSAVGTARAKINYTLTLDATRKVPNNRAYFTEKQREKTKTFDISLNKEHCEGMIFSIQPCPDDALNELNNELRFVFEGLPSAQRLTPSLAQQAQTTSFYPIGYEINCGTDNMCIDNLRVDFNFTNSLDIRVGIHELLNVTVAVENTGENSYNSRVLLTYPVGLSYRKFTSLQGRIECNSVDSEGGVLRGKTDCTVDKPIFKSNTKAFFIVSYGIEANSQLDRSIFITANATSGNQRHGSSDQLYKKKEIDVKYSIFVTLESLLSYSNFTYGKNDLQKPVEQSVKVTNDIRALNFTVIVKVPVKLGDKDIWANLSSLQIPDCEVNGEEEPTVTDFVAQIQKSKVVDCSVARCRAFHCTRFMIRSESKAYKISANMSSEWIQQIGLQSAKFLLISTASLSYDRNQYIFFSTGSNSNPPVHSIEVEVEVYPEPDFTKEIIGGTLGGLAFLALLTAVLYKAGFFKSKYKEMINAEGEEGPGPEESAPAQEQN
uniref:Integrin alpha-M-like n=1 Tax=Salarias fasciatus TaxID=181472 RepID=A0A672JMG8_SALFA